MADPMQLRAIEPIARSSIADQVFDILYAQVLSLELPPGTKMSEAEVAKQLDVSRQPVRDAFYRLSQLGFLVVQPQRATTVSQISAHDVFKARFVRTAIEVEIIRKACEVLTEAQIAELDQMLTRQQAAVDAGDRTGFHQLDDMFHKMICDAAGLSFAWAVIRENKAHTDRVRYLSLAFASQTALDDHRAIMDAVKARDPERAEQCVRNHLSRIEGIIERLRAENHAWFAEED
ncbi:GntR family transcriptional regulator [Actibacterium lipolyticum]|uniref:Putative HTH-type transcriptional regulator YdfH n=1 Tax=Actibacterium lipolyticum TaxID=1524263 RepID=A0A238KI90_9RHOB|nr:GntR family transcriptional regulator [Actibacterium lipolyticum]SMX42493.1 putative HTH-type transcriptional regulator YdfH [Actibacterium lipolyticum]